MFNWGEFLGGKLLAFLLAMLFAFLIPFSGGCMQPASDVADTFDTTVNVKAKKTLFGAELSLESTKEHNLECSKLGYDDTTNRWVVEGLKYESKNVPTLEAQGTRAQAIQSLMHEQILYQQQLGLNTQLIVNALGEQAKNVIPTLLGAYGIPGMIYANAGLAPMTATTDEQYKALTDAIAALQEQVVAIQKQLEEGQGTDNQPGG